MVTEMVTMTGGRSLIPMPEMCFPVNKAKAAARILQRTMTTTTTTMTSVRKVNRGQHDSVAIRLQARNLAT
jgi:hypothetical protein